MSSRPSYAPYAAVTHLGGTSMDHEGPSSATFGEYTGALRRRWWVLVLGAVIGLGLAAAYLLVAPKTYISTAAVRVDQIGTESDNTLEGARLNSGVNMDTEAQLVTSQAVSSRAKVNLQTTEIVGQLVQHVSVGVPANTNVLRISFTDNTAVGAQKGAEAYAKAYLENRRFTTSDFIDQQRMHCSNTSMSWKIRRTMHHQTSKPDSKHRSTRSKPGL